ncbi:uncharacterized protein LOC122663103 [Telopea speciosissima]|uniref:uncharacterized protein LOC122663103 n=1 Tax=Telopea speciosissima TaxID=54955 RepID=UPI001CC5343E|nr:uncharacterized protein LOC122663103 [Telopea speciosissima]
MATFDVTVDELKWFHGIDRDIFTVLVINLGRDIEESMRIIGFWLFLEELGHPNIILRMLSSPDTVIDSAATEAVLCLNCIDKDESPKINEFPSTKKLINRDISLSFCPHIRVSAVSKISKFVSDFGHKVFDDIVQKAIKHRSRVRDGQKTGFGMMGTSSSGFRPYGSHPDERTIFVTFARGYPISENELRDFFNMTYGECVEMIHMQKLSPNGQAMCGRVAFRSYETMEVILEGMDKEEKMKFWINGKHAWARKY